jgi:hypothetical protein
MIYTLNKRKSSLYTPKNKPPALMGYQSKEQDIWEWTRDLDPNQDIYEEPLDDEVFSNLEEIKEVNSVILNITKFFLTTIVFVIIIMVFILLDKS